MCKHVNDNRFLQENVLEVNVMKEYENISAEILDI